MAPLRYFSFRQVLVLYLVLFLFASTLVCACSEAQPRRTQFLGRRRVFEIEKEEQPKKTPSTSLSTKNQTKLVKEVQKEDQPKKKLDGTSSSKNQTKLVKPSTYSTKTTPTILNKAQLKKLNSTAKSSNSTKTTPTISATKQLKKLNSTSKASNSTKSSSGTTKKSSDLLKPSTPNDKTSKPVIIKQTKTQTSEKLVVLESKSKNSETNPPIEKKPKQQKIQRPTQPSWIDQEEDGDLVSEFRDLPSRFQKTLMPDLERISTTSKAYISKANKEITRGFKPIVGNKYAPTIAPVISFAFILLPLLLVSLIFNKIKAYFSLQKILIFIQVYLSIYFSILCLSSLVTGLEPLKFFYATSQSTYIWLQVLQTLGYVLYLLMLLMYLVLVFSTDCGLTSKLLGLLQTFVGFAIGLHYYVAVFHRVVLHQPPKTNWKVHGIYATCFLMICLFSRAERRKKAYLAEGGEEGKQN